jgi:hypothetical protein
VPWTNRLESVLYVKQKRKDLKDLCNFYVIFLFRQYIMQYANVSVKS